MQSLLNATLQRTHTLNGNNMVNVHQQRANNGFYHLQHETHDQLRQDCNKSKAGMAKMLSKCKFVDCFSF